jgi:membrane-associated phospholipid phosphatase
MRDLFWGVVERVPHTAWLNFTWLGDSGLMLPAALMITVWLALSRRTWPSAALWLVLFGFGASLILVSKLAFMGWGLGSARFNFTGFRGHTAISESVWPVMLWIVSSRAARWQRVALVLFAWALAAGIGVSRLALMAHSVSEVVTAFVIGVAVSGTFLVLQHHKQHPQLWWPVVVVSFLMPLLVHTPGTPAPTHNLLEQIAVELSGAERPYTREDLLRRG